MADLRGKGLLTSFGQKYFGGLGASPQVIGDATALRENPETSTALVVDLASSYKADHLDPFNRPDPPFPPPSPDPIAHPSLPDHSVLASFRAPLVRLQPH